uniref:Transposase n=1 Tax=Heligmosomoides polygyrus TaxID=6339 RepID=A0A183G0P2_HELPZ
LYTKQKFHDGIVDDARALSDVTLQSVETAEARRRGKGDNEDDDDGDWLCEDGARRRPRRTSTLHCPPSGS